MQARFISLKKRPETDQTPVPFMRPDLAHISILHTWAGSISVMPPQSPLVSTIISLLLQYSFSVFHTNELSRCPVNCTVVTAPVTWS